MSLEPIVHLLDVGGTPHEAFSVYKERIGELWGRDTDNPSEGLR
jgi:hypothetical protein